MAKDPRESPFVIDPKSVISASPSRGKSMIADMARRAGLYSGAVNIGDQINGRSVDRFWMDELSTRPSENHRSQFEHDYMTSASTTVTTQETLDPDRLRLLEELYVNLARAGMAVAQEREEARPHQPAGVETQDDETGSW